MQESVTRADASRLERACSRGRHFYVAFGRREQDDEEFFATAEEVVHGLEWELRRFAAECKSPRLASARDRVRSGPFDEADVASLR